MSKTMMEKADVIIIGGGIAGASIAYHLAEKSNGSISVILLEKRNVAEGTTAKSIGYAYYQHDYKIELDLSTRSIVLMKELDKDPENGINFRKNGLVYTAYTEEEVDKLIKKVELNKSWGVYIDMLQPQEFQKLLPDISLKEISIASFDPEGGYVDQHMLTATFVKKAKEKGTRVLTYSEVVDIKVSDNTAKAVEIEKGIIEGSFIVNTCGPWADRMFHLVGLNYPMQRVPGQIYAVKPQKKIEYKIPLTIDTHNRFYFREETGNIILLGQSDRVFKHGRRDVDPDEYYGFKKMPDSQFQEFIFENLEKRFPMLLEADLMSGWVGLRTVTPDALPIAGETEISRFLCSVGFSGGGIMLSPAVGELVADYIITGKKSEELEQLSIKRFSS